MDLEKNIKDFLFDYKEQKLVWDCNTIDMLHICIQMYKLTKEVCYKKKVFEFTIYIEMEMNALFLEEKEQTKETMQIGKLLFFLYEETKQEKYKKAMQCLIAQLRNCFIIEWDNINLELLSNIQPFYMAYETYYNNKENYNKIIEQFEYIRYCFYNRTENKVKEWYTANIGYYLVSLVDCIEAISIEIFEQYKKLVLFFKEVIKDIIWNRESKLYCFIERSNKEQYTEEDLLQYSMIGYVLLKACRLDIIAKEKYAPIGEKILKWFVTWELTQKQNLTVSETPKHSIFLTMLYMQKLELDRQ